MSPKKNRTFLELFHFGANFFKSAIREDQCKNFLSVQNNQNFLTMLKNRLHRLATDITLLHFTKKDRKAF
jgi:hypothetical protein